MGKQRSKILRRKAEQLLKEFPDKFIDDFEENKKVLKELGIFSSKTERNIVAGILTKIVVPKKL